MKRVDLVQAPLDVSSNPIPNVGSIPPLGLLALATYLEQELSNVDVRVIDGDFIGIDAAIQEIYMNRAQLVGIGVQSSESYHSALQLAEAAKETGATVVLGGEHASLKAKQILKYRPFVDYVVRGQGEEAIVELTKEHQLDSIPNLIYRGCSGITENAKSRKKLTFLPIPDRKHVDLRNYAEQFQTTAEAKLTKRKSLTTVKTQDGCIKAIKDNVCSFCKREDLFKLSFRNPTSFWEEMSYLHDLGIDYIWDISPSFSTAGLIYLDEIGRRRPRSLDIIFRIYARADDLADKNIVRALKRIGVENVLVGFDSGNQECLNSSNKHTIIEQHREAARNLREYEIATYSGFVLGHVAESYESMLDTLNHAKELRDIMGEKLFRITTCSKLQLYPGTWEYNKFVLSNEDLIEKYDKKDDINISELSELYFKEYLKIDPEFADEIAEHVRDLSPIKSGKDMRSKILSF